MREYKIKDGYFVTMHKCHKILHVTFWSTNNDKPICSIPVSIKSNKVFQFKSQEDATDFVLGIISLINEYCVFNDEGRGDEK